MEILISLLITLVAYLIFPICYRYSNGKVSEKKGKKIALWNSIICEAIFTIGGFAIGVEPATNGTMFAQGFFYYFIAKKILIDYSISEQKEIKKGEKTESFSICKNCGMQIFIDEQKCSNCNAANPYFNSSDNLKDSEEDNNQELKEELVEEEPIDDIDNVATTTSESNKEEPSSKVSIIKKLQIAIISVICVLVLFSIMYPISVNVGCKNSIPETTEFKTIALTRLDANQEVYCEISGNYNYLYIKIDNSIILYRFRNATMYDNSYVRAGYATSSQIKSYFGSNIYSGKPSVSFVAPATIPIGVILGVLMLSSIVVLGYLIHRFSEEEIFYLTKKDEGFISLKNDFKNEEINKYDYQKNIKELFSTKILQDNKFFKMFKFLY